MKKKQSFLKVCYFNVQQVNFKKNWVFEIRKGGKERKVIANYLYDFKKDIVIYGDSKVRLLD